MSLTEVVILGAIVLSAVAGLVLSLKREKKKGGCCGRCSGCKDNCSLKKEDKN